MLDSEEGVGSGGGVRIFELGMAGRSAPFFWSRERVLNAATEDVASARPCLAGHCDLTWCPQGRRALAPMISDPADSDSGQDMPLRILNVDTKEDVVRIVSHLVLK